MAASPCVASILRNAAKWPLLRMRTVSVERVKTKNHERLNLPRLRRPHPRHCRHRRNRRSPQGNHSGTRAPHPPRRSAEARAEQDSGGQLLGDIQSLDIVNFLSWRYQDPAKQLSGRLGIKPKHAYYGPVGGRSEERRVGKE